MSRPSYVSLWRYNNSIPFAFSRNALLGLLMKICQSNLSKVSMPVFIINEIDDKILVEMTTLSKVIVARISGNSKAILHEQSEIEHKTKHRPSYPNIFMTFWMNLKQPIFKTVGAFPTCTPVAPPLDRKLSKEVVFFSKLLRIIFLHRLRIGFCVFILSLT